MPKAKAVEQEEEIEVESPKAKPVKSAAPAVYELAANERLDTINGKTFVLVSKAGATFHKLVDGVPVQLKLVEGKPYLI